MLSTNQRGLSATYLLKKGGVLVLATTAKIGAKYLVNIDILKALGVEIEQLPEKERSCSTSKVPSLFCVLF